MIAAPRGTRDVLPGEQLLWQRVVRTAEELCEVYGYRRIDTPGFEETGLFARTSGEASDIVRKEMYTFEDRSGRSLTLRPEATAPIARAYAEHGLHREPQPVKLYTFARLYRYSAPQKGRYREHTQLSVEALGSDDPALDAELIQLYSELLASWGVEGWTLQLNSIGDRECRPAYVEALERWLDEHEAELDDDARAKRLTSPLRVFDTSNETLLAALEDAPKIGESLCGPCREHFAAVCGFLDAYGVPYELVPTLVRGLDYYTRTTFEFVGEGIGAKNSLVGGGRYDYLVEEIGGPPTPALGFGAGIERLLLQLEQQGVSAEEPAVEVFFACEEGAPRAEVLKLMAELRRRKRRCETDYAGRSLKGQLTHARRLGAEITVVAGESSATIRRRGLKDVVVSYDELLERLSS